MLLTYFLNDFEIVPVAPIITGITIIIIIIIICIIEQNNLGLINNHIKKAYGQLMILRVISGFRREVAGDRVLLGYYAASSGNFLPTFRDNLPVSY
jgi:hypothetical protein